MFTDPEHCECHKNTTARAEARAVCGVAQNSRNAVGCETTQRAGVQREWALLAGRLLELLLERFDLALQAFEG